MPAMFERLRYHQVNGTYNNAGLQRCTKCDVVVADRAACDDDEHDEPFDAGAVTEALHLGATIFFDGAHEDAVPCWIAETAFQGQPI